MLSILDSGGNGIEFFVQPGGLVDKVEDGENEESKTDEAETKYLATSEGSHETSREVLDLALRPLNRDVNILGFVLSLLWIGVRVEEFMEVVDVLGVELLIRDLVLDHIALAAVVGGSGIGVNGNSHTNVTRGDGGDGTNEERNSSVGEVGGVLFSGDLGGIDSEADNKCEDAAEK